MIITVYFSSMPKFMMIGIVCKWDLLPLREPLKVPHVGQPKNPFFSKSVHVPLPGAAPQ